MAATSKMSWFWEANLWVARSLPNGFAAEFEIGCLANARPPANLSNRLTFCTLLQDKCLLRVRKFACLCCAALRVIAFHSSPAQGQITGKL